MNYHANAQSADGLSSQKTATQSLNNGWTLRCARTVAAASITPDMSWEATVPGCVHTDLMAARTIPDPYLDCNELAVQWVGDCDWTYETEFNADLAVGQRHTLVFHGLDTVATVSLNGDIILESENMHRTYRVDVTDKLKAEGNALKVDFLSPYQHEKKLREELEPRPNCYPGPGNLMRKMACNFGWDWGPTLVTAGIWRNVDLVSWSTAKIDNLRTDVSMTGADGQVCIHAGIDGMSEGLELEARIGDQSASTFLSGNVGFLELNYPAPHLWWPHGMGGQPLYDLEVSLKKDGELLERQTRRIGFRTIELDLSGDDDQSAFTFIVNGKPVFVFGANWIPDDCFPARITRDRLAERITQAKDANMNMLRIWGGGIYESDDFYDLCDEAGIMVWQDFLFACAAYPEEGTLPAEIEAEAKDNISRLMSHASLAIWNGNNENIWGFQAWGWQKPLAGKTWGEGYYLDLLPRLVDELHPSGTYYPGSPYSGSMERFANADEHGCRHIWDVWNEVGYEVYANYAPRFVSEFGWQAPPTMATLTQSISDNPLTPTSPGVMHHQKASEGNEKLLRGLKGHLPEPDSFEDWHFTTQLNQARAIHFGISHFRALQPHCMGSIVWQLNDCWPVTSWAAIDGYGRKKPLWYALKKAYEPHFLTVQPSDSGLTLHIVNDANLEWRTPVSIKRVSFDGKELAEHTIWRVCVERNKPISVQLPESITTPNDKSNELIVVTADGCKTYYYFQEDIGLKLPEPRLRFDIEVTASITRIVVTAETFVKDLCLFADRIGPDVTVDRMLDTLLPGDTLTLELENAQDLSLEDLSHPGVIRTANTLLAS
ncbi:glycoside hydrolase family 2 protein [Roseibium porphyridii]|uniref:beta-mannosidase n=1 Tax=Roseibium porphyridii TaxID=2866279 RepID=A0ABY8FFY5_9HYPH|nr:glycoside hydrolase family 2 protein [Roseibium sp. KMA01]WFE91488.1 glycoside hydrolase family 2 protein [Roseibium sp. KMA01]